MAKAGSAAALASLGHLVGKPEIEPNQISKKEIRTNEGTEMKIMTMVEIRESTHVFFFKAAIMPNPIHNGTEMTIETIFSLIEYGKPSINRAMAGCPKDKVVEVPQSQAVNIFLIQLKYLVMIG